jgi:hypothetical protein
MHLDTMGNRKAAEQQYWALMELDMERADQLLTFLKLSKR